MKAVLDIVLVILNVATTIIFVQAIMSWLLAFNVLSIHNSMVRQIWETLQRITEPVYAPIRRILPPMGGLDLTPMVAIIAIIFIRQLIFRYGYALMPF